jgi:RNA ligase
MLRRLAGIGEVPADLTLLFEIVFPALPGSVVDYGKLEELVLLAGYNRFTGEELPWREIEGWAARLGARTPKIFEFSSIDELLETKASFPDDLEGVVIRFEQGLRVKLKGDVYLALLREKKGFSRNALAIALEEGRGSEFLERVDEEFRPEAARFLEELCREAGAFEAEATRHFARAPQSSERADFARWASAEVPAAYRPALFVLRDGGEPNWFLSARKARERKKGR